MAVRLQAFKGLRKCLRSLVYRSPTRLFSSMEPARAIDEAFSFDANTEGQDIVLNWSLVDESVTPKDKCYGNLSTKGLVMRSEGKIGSDKALHIEDNYPSPQDRSAQHDAIYGQVAGYLSDVDEIFVDDAAVGSFRGCELGIRLVSDDAALALYAQNMHVRVPIRSSARDPNNPGHSVTVLLAGKIDCPPFLSYKIEDGQAQVVFGGRTSLQAIQETIAGIAREIVTTRDGSQIPIPGNSYIDGADVILAIPLGSGFDPISDQQLRLNGAHEHIWCEEGLARMFGGARYAGVPGAGVGFGNVIAGGNAVSPLKDSHNLVAHPTKIVFLADDAEGDICSATAKARLTELLSEDHAQQIIERASQHGTTFATAATL